MLFDAPVFKILASNDTAQAPGHQGGIVIPKNIEQYFPNLEGDVSAENPTLDQIIDASLFIGGKHVDTVKTRYQFQTWGGERSPERRLTSGLGAIRNVAQAGDVVLFERSVDDLFRMRITLIQRDSADFDQIRDMISDRRWGPLDKSDPPVSVSDEMSARASESKTEEEPFTLFDNRRRTVSRREAIARSRMFRARLLELYDYKCAVTGFGLKTVSGLYGVDAAHIVPRYKGGADDARNGIVLSRNLHWAFDYGLFGITRDRMVHVPDAVLRMPENQYLAEINGTPVQSANVPHLMISGEAVQWHMDNVVAAVMSV